MHVNRAESIVIIDKVSYRGMSVKAAGRAPLVAGAGRRALGSDRPIYD